MGEGWLARLEGGGQYTLCVVAALGQDERGPVMRVGLDPRLRTVDDRTWEALKRELMRGLDQIRMSPMDDLGWIGEGEFRKPPVV